MIAATQLVPYPLPLNRPPIDRRILRTQISGAILQSGIAPVTPPKVLIAYARDFSDGVHAILPPHCIVIVGRARRSIRQRFRARCTAKSLEKLGFEVVLA